MMTGVRTFAAVLAAFAFTATALSARAEAPRAPVDGPNDYFSSAAAAPDQNRWGPQPTHKMFQWDEKGHWGLRLDLSQPVGRDMELRDIQAGAFFHVTPSLRVGGAVALGDSTVPDRTVVLPQGPAPRVQLETNFKF
jgi:hypothetical protein